MGLLQKLLSTLGIRESDPGRGSERSGETTVTVEHEPDTASESAVKGTEGVTDDTADAGSAETDASTADSSDEGDTAVAVEEAEPEVATDAADEAVSDETVADEAASEETETDDGPVDESVADEGTTAESPAGSEESTDVLNGIGPAYAERLENAGVETVADLAAADAADLADETGLGEGRISNWIEQAKEY